MRRPSTRTPNQLIIKSKQIYPDLNKISFEKIIFLKNSSNFLLQADRVPGRSRAASGQQESVPGFSGVVRSHHRRVFPGEYLQATSHFDHHPTFFSRWALRLWSPGLCWPGIETGSSSVWWRTPSSRPSSIMSWVVTWWESWCRLESRFMMNSQDDDNDDDSGE